MRHDKYILDGKIAVKCHDFMEWAEWYAKADRRVDKTYINGVIVSTVFLAADHAYDGPPMLFETMVFGGPMDQHQDRCSTWGGAELMHASMVAKVKENQQ